MIGKIVRKELLSNLLTLRFAVGTALLVILTVLFSSILISDYRQALKEYDRFVSKNSAELKQVLTYQNLTPTIYKPPEILTLFSKGVEENVAKSAQISVEEIPVLTNAGTSKNPLLAMFSVLDIVLVFKLVISVLAVLLAYDAISGEKEDGTLRLMLSNETPRYKILWAKFLAGLLTLAIPIALGFLTTILIMALSPVIVLTGENWLRIALMAIVSLVVVSVFLSIGLLVSSLTKRASDTLLVLLFIWVTFLLIIPNVSSYLATQFKPVEMAGKLNAQIREIGTNLNIQISNISRQLPPESGYDVESDAQELWGGYVKFGSAAFFRGRIRLMERILPLSANAAREIGELKQTYIRQLIEQRKWADSLARISPLSLYENLMSALSRTDISSLEAFSRQARDYRQKIVDFLEKRKAFSSVRYFSTIPEDKIFEVKNAQEYMAVYIKYAHYQPKPIDLSDFPEFHYRQASVLDSLREILPDLLILIFMGIVFLACAFVAVLKYDVR